MNIDRTAVSTRTEIIVRQFAAVTAQVGLLWFMSWLGHQVVALLQLPMPGNVAGLLLTFLALTGGVLPLRVLEPGAGLLVRNLPVFFVPLAIPLQISENAEERCRSHLWCPQLWK